MDHAHASLDPVRKCLHAWQVAAHGTVPQRAQIIGIGINQQLQKLAHDLAITGRQAFEFGHFKAGYTEPTFVMIP